MKKKDLMYEGKAKKLYTTEDPNIVVSEFKDDLTAFNAIKKSNEEGKGSLNCQISSEIFKMLETKGIPTHFLDQMNANHMLCKKVEIIMIEVVVRNVATGSLTRRLGIPDGKILPFPIIEFCYKSDAYQDPVINDDHALVMELVDNAHELDELRRLGREVNATLKQFFSQMNLTLVDFKIEFGKDSQGTILLADEISPDSCRFWDMRSGEKLDKDRFREGIGGVKVAYEEVLKRIHKHV
jgi:phosphoribosylaminoimidazole-succinocarboxamide synthase